MTFSPPVRDAARFLARLAAFTPDEWRAVAAAAGPPVPPGSPELTAALRWLDLPGRREAHTVLHEWLDALATSLLASVDRTGADAGDPMRALHLAEQAAVALLVADALDARVFDRLYAPFAAVVPVPSLRARTE